ncbi:MULTISPECIES: DUF2335 domain-containing protein [Bifidobacterium]|nr:MULTISPECIES: DUF2335 domain-containing protein [Bifidobacterium]
MSMNDLEQSDSQGSQKRSPDRFDGTVPQAQPETTRDGDGPAGKGVVDGGPQPASIDGQSIDLEGQIAFSRSGPLPLVSEFEGYERVLAGSADRIVTMAEKALDSQIEGEKAAREIEAADHRAENMSMMVASFAFSFLPWVAFISATVCAAAGNNTAAAFGGIIGVVSAGPQIIDAVKRKRK